MDTFQYDTGHRQPAVSFAAGSHLDQISASFGVQQQQHQQSGYTTIGMPPVSMQPPPPPQQQQMDTQMADSQQQQHCGICGDRATGKHYGAYSCDGCKGFFRRSVRKSHQYICRFNRCCTVDRDKRNQCRYCRLDKCFRAGMRKEAVQNERDKISFRKTSSAYDDGVTAAATATAKASVPSSGVLKIEAQEAASAPPQAAHPPPDGQQQPDFSLGRIVSAEDRHQHRQRHTQHAADAVPPGQQPVRSEASVATICDSMQHQLLLLVEWAKSFPAFIELNVEEQVALLRAHAGELLILGVTYRSRTETGMLILGNSFRVSSNNPDVYMAQVAGRVINELVSQFRELEIDFSEYACLKTVVFFDPDAVHLSSSVSIRVRRWRHAVLQRMQDYMSAQQYRSRSRFGELLLLLPKLQSINHEMIRKVYRTKVEGLAHIDTLLQELLLGDNAEASEATQQPMGASGGQLNSSAAGAYHEADIMAQMEVQVGISQHYQNGTAHDRFDGQYAATQELYLNYDNSDRAVVSQASASAHQYGGGTSDSMVPATEAAAVSAASRVSLAPSSSSTFDNGFRGFPGVPSASVYKQEP